MELMNKLNEMLTVPGVSGREHPIANYLAEQIRPYVDEVKIDNLGNVIAHRKADRADAKRLMLAAHMDEIGLIVTHITKEGMLKVGGMGYIDLVASAYTEVRFANGVRGVFVPDAKTEAKDYKIDKFVVDIGATDEADARTKVQIGDTATLGNGMMVLSGERVCGHPFDDRVGCLCVLEAARTTTSRVNDTYFVFTVQEEVGCRGARPATFSIAPDYGVALDVTDTGDYYGADPMAVKLGGGAAIKLKDRSVLCDMGFVEQMKEIAKAENIPYQLEIMLIGGTDTCEMQTAAGGAIVGAISIPTRYTHTMCETMDTRDVAACAALAARLVETPLA